MNRSDYVRKEILITMMTYPHPSKTYIEVVCTGGITEDFEFVRLYPIDLRYRPNEQVFRKYQWIEALISKRITDKDQRKESRKPDLDSIRVLSSQLSRKNGWSARRAIVDRMPHLTIKKLMELYEHDKTSIGIIRPKRILGVKYEKSTEEWKPQQEDALRQFRLFGQAAPKPLTKIPYKFVVEYLCEDDDNPRTNSILDWEVGMLFLNSLWGGKSEDRAAKAVVDKLDGLFSNKYDTRFFVGTIYPYNKWTIVGLFAPPETGAIQDSLFIQN